MSSLRIPPEKCPKCRNSVQVRLEQRGQWLTCPYCNQSVQFGIGSSSEAIGSNNSLTAKQIIILLAVGLGTIGYLVIYHPSLKSPVRQVGGFWNKPEPPTTAVQIVPDSPAPAAASIQEPQPKVPSAEDDYGRGLAYATGYGVTEDKAEAAKWFRKAADQGHADAQFRLGLSYRLGYGFPKDFTEAAKWYRKAAEQGHANAQYQLGDAYFIGEGVVEDDEEAVKWFRKAADQGHANAQFRLGAAYYDGRGVQESYEKAIEWLRKAAAQGNAKAQFGVGLCFDLGKGVPEDDTVAVQWYRAAADQGNAKAQVHLGLAFAFGEGITKNPVMAYKWFLLAHASGEKGFDEELDSRRKSFMRAYGEELTPLQRGEAQRLASEFKPVKAGTNQ